MRITRRDFVKAVAAAAVLPVSSGTPATTWAVNRRNMWPHDRTSAETLARCNRLLAVNPDDVLALVHRGQIPSIYYNPTLAWADLSRAISLEPQNPCVWYVRGTCFNRAEDLRHAISLLSKGGDISGKAICSSQPDIYKWHGTDDGELYYMAYRDLGDVLEEEGRIDEAVVVFEVAASFQVISQADLEKWCESDMQVGRWCEALIGVNRLIEIEDKAEYPQHLVECERWLQVPRSAWRARVRGRDRPC